jgi:hypothetical protein
MNTSLRAMALALAGAGSLFGAQAQTPAAAPAAHTYGRLERARIDGSSPIEVEALLDGSGEYTVLHVLNLKYASGEGGMYVHFTVDNGHVLTGKQVNLSLPVLKDQHVQERNGGVEHHPVVAMSFCIGDRDFSTNVVLLPRTTFTPPLELSKADAAPFAPVDPAKKLTGDPSCTPPAPAAAPAKAAAQ